MRGYLRLVAVVVMMGSEGVGLLTTEENLLRSVVHSVCVSRKSVNEFRDRKRRTNRKWRRRGRP